MQLNSVFGAQAFLVVRSDEVHAGNTVHVFSNPPGQWLGTVGDASTHGTLRIKRTGAVVTGYYNGIPLASGTYNTNAATLWFSLQNNGTSDATSVAFSDFAITADQLVAVPPKLGIGTVNGAAVVSWATAVTPFTLVTTTNLESALSWTTVPGTVLRSGYWNYVTNHYSDAARFFRLRSP